MTFLKKLRAAWALFFGRVSAPRLDDYYAEARRDLVHLDEHGLGLEQSVSMDVVRDAPKVWRSSPDHVIAYLTYISAEEAAILAALDLHGSGVSRKMHFGPNGVPSYQGDGGDGTGDGSGTGESTSESSTSDNEDDSEDDDDDTDTEEDTAVGYENALNAAVQAMQNYSTPDFDTGESDEGPADTTGPTGEASGLPPGETSAPQTPADLLSQMLQAPPPTEMPMPENASARLARRRSARMQSRRRGRTSTILSNLDPLGG